jgi:deoxyribose-phosphate aldolase
VAKIGDEILARLKVSLPAVQGPSVIEPASADGRPDVSDSDLAAMIDHTLLRPEATGVEIDRLCEEAKRYGFASVCINPYWVSRAKRQLRGSEVKVCTVIGFPFGANATATKIAETEAAIRCGASEVDMVINIGALRSGDMDRVRQDIAAVAARAHSADVLVKAIIETALLDEHQKVVACTVAKNAGADYVKTSTGFAKQGATAADVALMRRVVGPEMGVKASGGIRTRGQAKAMIAAGATRIGASTSVNIVTDRSEAGHEY